MHQSTTFNYISIWRIKRNIVPKITMAQRMSTSIYEIKVIHASLLKPCIILYQNFIARSDTRIARMNFDEFSNCNFIFNENAQNLCISTDNLWIDVESAFVWDCLSISMKREFVLEFIVTIGYRTEYGPSHHHCNRN